jgi:trk system potassium uptake protein TrkA
VHVVVVGAGEVGSFIADRLSKEGHDVAIIDKNTEKLRRLDETLDVLTVAGSGSDPDVLRRAGIVGADLLLAVTSSDEANVLATMLGRSLGAERAVVRIESEGLQSPAAEAVLRNIGADLFIDPDGETARKVLELIDFPGTDEVNVMAKDKVLVIGATLGEDAPLAGRTLEEIGEEFEPDWAFMVAAIGRSDETFIPRRDHRLEVGDHVRIVAKRSARQLISDLLGLDRTAPKKVMVLGGGRTGELLARSLRRHGIDVRVMERDPVRARLLAENLGDVQVIEGDITDDNLLDEAEVGRCEVVVAMTGEDDANILACLYAKKHGTRETIAVLHRLALLDLLSDAGVDAALSPRTATASAVMRFVRGDVDAVATFLHGQAEVLELTVAQDHPADGSLVADLDFPKEALIAAFVRDGVAEIARGRSRLTAGDRLVVVSMPSCVDEVHRIIG